MFWRSGTVTLVIDDGPSETTDALLGALERHGHRGVCFILGANLPGREGALVSAIRRGHALGNHSFSHPHFSEITLDVARDEVARTEALIGRLYAEAGQPRPGRWFRFPYLDRGEANEGAFQEMLAGFGFSTPAKVLRRDRSELPDRRDWPSTKVSADWERPPIEKMKRRLRKTRPGDVVEIHDYEDTFERYIGLVCDILDRRRLRAVIPG